MNFKTAIAAVLVSAVSLPVLAQTPSPDRIDQRQANQQQRIEQGVRSGELTPREANRLENGQEHVQRMENRAKADGVVTGKEAARIERAQDKQSRKIKRQKHDAQHDYNHDGKKDRHHPKKKHHHPVQHHPAN